MNKVERPKADEGKINCKDEFELCYIRHMYFRRATKNPSAEEMAPYLKVVEQQGKKTYYTYKNLFHTIGFSVEDLVAIAQIHLVSFLGLFSLEEMPEKYADFVKNFRKKEEGNPSSEDVVEKNKANLTLFLKQRMEDVVRICRQKARNIKGVQTEEYMVFYGPAKPPKYLTDLIGKHEKYGYRKLEMSVYRAIRKQVRIDEDTQVFQFQNNYYVILPVRKKSLEENDFTGSGVDPRDSLHNMSPEQIYFNSEEERDWDRRQEVFFSKAPAWQIHRYQEFIEKHKADPKFREEVRTARKKIRELTNE